MYTVQIETRDNPDTIKATAVDLSEALTLADTLPTSDSYTATVCIDGLPFFILSR